MTEMDCGTSSRRCWRFCAVTMISAELVSGSAAAAGGFAGAAAASLFWAWAAVANAAAQLLPSHNGIDRLIIFLALPARLVASLLHVSEIATNFPDWRIWLDPRNRRGLRGAPRQPGSK